MDLCIFAIILKTTIDACTKYKYFILTNTVCVFLAILAEFGHGKLNLIQHVKPIDNIGRLIGACRMILHLNFFQ